MGGWRCFHCNAVFTREQDAAEHFGGDQGALAACQIKGHEHLLVQAIREQEALLHRYRQETDPLLLAMEALRSEHAHQLRRAEEAGYDRGVRDAYRESVPSPSAPAAAEAFGQLLDRQRRERAACLARMESTTTESATSPQPEASR
jgi:hypothetical protein